MRHAIVRKVSEMRRFVAVVMIGMAAACTGDPQAQRPSTGAAGVACSGPQRIEAEGGGCIAVRRYGRAQADTLIVMLHGDVSSGGPASYHFPFAERIASENPTAAVAAIVRPGYPDGSGNVTAGNNFGRIDQYTAANMDLMAGAIRALKREAGATRVIAIGHSGGAATIANILARDPTLIGAAGLLACNCNIAAWRQGRQPWVRSLDPYRVADQVPVTTRVIGFTGSNDVNAFPSQKKSYIDRLAARGVTADFVIVPGAGHNSIDEMWRAGLSAWVAREVSAPPSAPLRTS